MGKLTRRQAIEKAARAHSNLTTLGGVIEVLEASMYGGNERTNRVTSRMIAACKKEQQALLTDYDMMVLSALRAVA